jgi:hypothetical protein
MKLAHPLGEWKDEEAESLIIDTFAGRVHVEWNPQAEVTPLGQLPFFINFLEFIRTGEAVKRYEYRVVVTSLKDGILSIAQFYRDRADAENIFDELKNQWGWGGFTTQDIHRCQVMARNTALIYNWWSIFARLAILSLPISMYSEHGGYTIKSNHLGIRRRPVNLIL